MSRQLHGAARIASATLHVQDRLSTTPVPKRYVFLSYIPSYQLDNDCDARVAQHGEALRRPEDYAINDKGPKLALRWIAVPVRDASGKVVAALNCGSQSFRVSVAQPEKSFRPILLSGAQEPSVLLP